MHHAWLLAGPRGIGKARFAEVAARRLLAGTGAGLVPPPDHPSAALVDAGSHPDFVRLERLPREKGEGLARNIAVDQVRGLGRVLGSHPSLGPWRVVVIDAMDDLEREGANALLKSLEEPPARTVFLLVSHQPGRLLPTIRSRCRLLRFAPLADADMRAALADALPEAADAERAALALAGQGAPGAALRLAGLDVGGLDEAFATLIREGDPLNQRRAALARSLSAKAAAPRYELFLERAPAAIAAVARGRTGAALAEAIALWESARALATAAPRLSLDPQTTVFEIAGLLARLGPSAAKAA